MMNITSIKNSVFFSSNKDELPEGLLAIARSSPELAHDLAEFDNLKVENEADTKSIRRLNKASIITLGADAILWGIDTLSNIDISAGWRYGLGAAGLALLGLGHRAHQINMRQKGQLEESYQKIRDKFEEIS